MLAFIKTSPQEAAFALFSLPDPPIRLSTFAFAFARASLFSDSCLPLSFSLSSFLLHAVRDLIASSSYFRQTLKAFLQDLSEFAMASDSFLNLHDSTEIRDEFSVLLSQQVQASAPFFLVQAFTESAKDLVELTHAANLVLFGFGKFAGLHDSLIFNSHSSNFAVKFASCLAPGVPVLPLQVKLLLFPPPAVTRRSTRGLNKPFFPDLLPPILFCFVILEFCLSKLAITVAIIFM